jgi:hypothetical protein
MQNDHINGIMMGHKKNFVFFLFQKKVQILIFCIFGRYIEFFIFRPILMQFFLRIYWAKSFQLHVNEFPLYFMISEMNSTERRQQKPNFNISTFLFYIQF